MTKVEFVNIIAMITGPVMAVLITLWHQQRSEERNHKYTLFRTLMKRRRGLNQDWVDALNLIDVVFYDNQEIVNSWHLYHEMLYRQERDHEEENRKYLDLLHSIALSLGYKKVKQTDIDRFYEPIGLEEQKMLNEALQKEQLTYLQNSNQSFSSQITPNPEQ